MADTHTPVGWLGVGAMGLPMLGHLVRAGFAVSAFDPRAERRDLAAEAGATPVADPLTLARQCPVLCTMVYDDAALEGVVSTLEPALSPGQLLIDFSTVSPEASARVARVLDSLDVAYVRAPVSGSVMVAQAGALSVFVSGPPAACERCLPLLRALSQAQRQVGEGEAARVVKLAINLLLVNHTALLGEALALAESWGVPRAEMVACVNGSILGSRHTQARAEALATRRYSGAGPLQVGAKDLDLALSMAREKALGLPISAYVRQYLTQLLADGHGEVEISKLAEFPGYSPHTPH